MKTGDYILITDCNDDYYLKIGEILSTKYKDSSKEVIGFEVTFGEISEYGALVVKTYTSNELKSNCRVLQFADKIS